ncbi:ketosteroid isomerase-like protein [Kitasatospora sp. MAP12-15]|uniref:nuclear transport factor 2 family protein n=1 Tax=unclassified Kitasatospora TaxID=2633591 RepID=UPI002473BA1D|nr:nuclear transport factor 2 family protein [Kitasatospora sp. MAP12-44]MDH6114495.1 ketosteroid isomerase-like protein [Kitasatospora sp. MAP12-44]
MANIAARTPQETYESHGKALLAEDLDALVLNFAEDAVFITPSGVKHGREGVREAFAQLFSELPHAQWDIKIATFAADVLFLEWSATSDRNQADQGVDTFVFRDGLIQTQTVRYLLTPNS